MTDAAPIDPMHPHVLNGCVALAGTRKVRLCPCLDNHNHNAMLHTKTSFLFFKVDRMPSHVAQCLHAIALISYQIDLRFSQVSAFSCPRKN
jgi:hypothetical protein